MDGIQDLLLLGSQQRRCMTDHEDLSAHPPRAGLGEGSACPPLWDAHVGLWWKALPRLTHTVVGVKGVVMVTATAAQSVCIHPDCPGL